MKKYLALLIIIFCYFKKDNSYNKFIYSKLVHFLYKKGMKIIAFNKENYKKLFQNYIMIP
ncbi:hypothetical protein UJ101_01526 [Flavobacteriaceae bacterium UJ101]|nr:hypothetical protein UJ101_01526 [Flavobacteriaceae bacterium UJ101]